MNKAILVGRLTKEPEAKTTPNGVSVTTFTIAVTRRANKEEADFLNIITWRGLADNCAKYLVKGQRVSIAGEIRTRSYDAKDGSKRYVTEIQAEDVEFLDRPAHQGDLPNVTKAKRVDEEQKQYEPDGMVEVDISDDDLPF